MKRCFPALLILLLVAVLVSCRQNEISPPPADPTPVVPTVLAQQATPTVTVPTATVEVAQVAQPVGAGEPLTVSELTEEDAPLRFTFPTPIPQPISLWRPPLYDTPWALGPHDHFFLSRPIAADEVNWPIADYRYGGVFFSSEIIHTGVDIPAPLHNTIIAAGPGRVIWTGYGLYYGNNDPKDPYGLAVTVRHEFGFDGRRIYTVYAHMDRIDVVTGQDVKTGDPLGIVGTTGNTTGPHLHFEVRLEKNAYSASYNPELWMAPPQGWGVLVGRILNTNGANLSGQSVTVRNIDTRDRWVVNSYGYKAVNADPYYQENMALSDLPAGNYEVTIVYLEKEFTQELKINPGAITFFTFRGEWGFNMSPPPAPKIEKLMKPFP